MDSMLLAKIKSFLASPKRFLVALFHNKVR